MINFIFSVLLIGDSHFVGDMGTYLMKMYPSSAMLAITGAGSITYTKSKIRNPCCLWTYRGWKNNKLYTIKKGKKKGEYIYPGSLKLLIKQTKPKMIIIHLGNNEGNDHVNLLKLIRTQTNVPVYWVGMFRVKSHKRINYLIKKTSQKFKNVTYIDVTDLRWLDAMHTNDIHYAGSHTKIWAKRIRNKIRNCHK